MRKEQSKNKSGEKSVFPWPSMGFGFGLLRKLRFSGIAAVWEWLAVFLFVCTPICWRSSFV